MIDEEATFAKFGYRSTDLTFGSGKLIVAVCDDCGRVRILKMEDYRDLCHNCAMKSKKVRAKIVEARNRPEVKAKQREAIKKLWEDSDIRAKYAKAIKKSQNRPEVKAKQRETWENKTPEEREEYAIYHSCKLQGIPREEFDGFVDDKYCYKFNESCREHNREKYDRKCFLCDKTESENGSRLSVHHIDGNKNQGCNDFDWHLVPLCNICHGKTIGKKNEDLWHARIMYLRKHVWKDSDLFIKLNNNV